MNYAKTAVKVKKIVKKGVLIAKSSKYWDIFSIVCTKLEVNFLKVNILYWILG